MNLFRTALAVAALLGSTAIGHAGTAGLSQDQVQTLQGLFQLRHPGARLVFQASAPPAGVYTFTLDGFQITNTRSVFDDTDYASIAVAVGNNPPITVPAVSLGSIDNGVYSVHLQIPNVTVQSGQAVSFSYAIVNSGYKQDTLEQDLISWIGRAAQKAAAVGAADLAAGLTGNTSAASLASQVGQQAGGWAINQLLGIIFADCDGTVAAGDHIFSGAQLANDTNGGLTYWQHDNNPGTDSPAGCGSNSQYYATWSVHPSNVAEQAPPLSVTGNGAGGGGGNGGHHLLN